MNRREALIAIGGAGTVGGSLIIGGSLYGSSNLALEPTDDGTRVRQNGERIDSLTHPVTPVEDETTLLGISIPGRSTVQTVSVEVVWTIRRDGIWSDIIVELVSTGDIWVNLHSGVAIAYSSSWGSSPSEADGSTFSRRRYAYPSGTTAGRVTSLLTVQGHTDSEEEMVELEARLSARSLSGTHVELTAPAELIYSPD